MVEQKKIFTWDYANEAMPYISTTKPSEYVPFKGKLPLLQPWQEELYSEQINKHKYFDDLDTWVKDIILKAKKIRAIDKGFQEYLEMNGFLKTFFSLDNSQKATELIRFFNANCISYESLSIN